MASGHALHFVQFPPRSGQLRHRMDRFNDAGRSPANGPNVSSFLRAAIIQPSVAHWQLIAVPQKLSFSSPLIQARAPQLDLNRIYFVQSVKERENQTTSFMPRLAGRQSEINSRNERKITSSRGFPTGNRQKKGKTKPLHAILIGLN